MKSRYFTDTQALDAAPLPRERIYVCLCLSRRAYEKALAEACRLHMTSGEYMDHLIFSACGTTGLPKANSPWRRLPPAPPDH